MRSTRQPFFLVIDTYRFSPHSKGDDFRDPEEIAARRERDPLTVAGAHLDAYARREIDEACAARVADAVEQALASPSVAPEPSWR